MPKRHRTRALAAIHETASGLAASGVLGKRTMKMFDELCLTPVAPLTPRQIRDIRLRAQASQARRDSHRGALEFSRAHRGCVAGYLRI